MTPGTKRHNDHDFAERAEFVRCERDGYLIQWNGWMDWQGSTRVTGFWTAYPVVGALERYTRAPFLCVMAGARGEGSYRPGANFDVRPHPTLPPLTWESFEPDQAAVVETELQRTHDRIHALVDCVVAGRTRAQDIPVMRHVVSVYIDGSTGQLLSNDEVIR